MFIVLYMRLIALISYLLVLLVARFCQLIAETWMDERRADKMRNWMDEYLDGRISQQSRDKVLECQSRNWGRYPWLLLAVFGCVWVESCLQEVEKKKEDAAKAYLEATVAQACSACSCRF